MLNQRQMFLDHMGISYEHHRTKALENLNESDDFSSTLDVLTLSQNSEFYMQKAFTRKAYIQK